MYPPINQFELKETESNGMDDAGEVKVSLLTSAPTGDSRMDGQRASGAFSNAGAGVRRLTFSLSNTTLESPSADSARDLLNLLAGLLEYPRADLLEQCQRVEPLPTVSHDLLGPFRSAMEALSLDQQEELYTATFDITPACAPYASIHLFGEENFKRGEFMAALSIRLVEAGIDRRGELPDHISVLLRLAARLDQAERRELAEFVLLSALPKMIAALDPVNPYHALLAAARAAVLGMFPGVTPVPAPVDQAHRCGPMGLKNGCASGGCGASSHNL